MSSYRGWKLMWSEPLQAWIAVNGLGFQGTDELEGCFNNMDPFVRAVDAYVARNRKQKE